MAGPIYTIADLGTLGGDSAQAFGLNSTGQAVGAASIVSGYTHAFSSSGSGLTDLTVGTSASEGMAAAVNGAGQIAGTQFTDGLASATLWTNGIAESIAGAGSYGMAINEEGQIAGMLTTPTGQGEAFVTVNGYVQDLGTLPGGTWSAAYAIDSSGDVAGYGNIRPGVFRAFVWSPETGYSALGTFGGTNSYAMAIDDSGQVAGNAQLADGYSNAFLWSGGGLLDLGTLGLSSYAYGVNNAGEVVGDSMLANGDTHAFLYEGGAMLDLNSLIDPASGWVLTQAYGINASGQIAGAGLFDGVEHAVLLTDPPASVPEPATWIVVAGGLAVLASRRVLSASRSKLRNLRRCEFPARRIFQGSVDRRPTPRNRLRRN
jgi:probable HAF family extracellular repeat protein